MGEFKEKKIKLVVKSSKCSNYKEGDAIYINRSLIDKEKSGNLCLTALVALYPFIYAARKHVTAEQMGFSEMCFQCPDIDDRVEFRIVQYDEEDEMQ
ncbi:MAG: TIGR04076 family protein [Chloroflexota bacterium]